MRKKRSKKGGGSFNAWLDSKGMTAWDFAQSVNIPQSTIVKWRQHETRKPQRLALERVRKMYPDCPVLAR